MEGELFIDISWTRTFPVSFGKTHAGDARQQRSVTVPMHGKKFVPMNNNARNTESGTACEARRCKKHRNKFAELECLFGVYTKFTAPCLATAKEILAHRENLLQY